MIALAAGLPVAAVALFLWFTQLGFFIRASLVSDGMPLGAAELLLGRAEPVDAEQVPQVMGPGDFELRPAVSGRRCYVWERGTDRLFVATDDGGVVRDRYLLTYLP